MSHCTNINHPQIQDWAKKFNVEPEYIGAIVSLWQETSNDLEKIPSNKYVLDQIIKKKKGKVEVKPGVEELFEENHQFASEIYEALGFNATSEVTLGEATFNPDNYEAISYPIKINGKNAGIFSVDKDGYISSSIGMAGVELNEEFQGKGYGTKIYLTVANKLAKEGKTLKSEKFGKNNINESANRVWKSLLNKQLAVDKGDYFEIKLDSKQDIENFTNFVSNSNVGNVEDMLNYMNSKPLDFIINKLIDSGKIKKEC